MSDVNESTQRGAGGERSKKAEQGFGHWKLESAITKRPRKVVIRWKAVQTTSPTSSSSNLPSIAPSPSTSSWVFVDSPSASPVCENKKRTKKLPSSTTTTKPRLNATNPLEAEDEVLSPSSTLPPVPYHYSSSSPSSTSPQTCSPFFLPPPAFQTPSVCPSTSSPPPPPPFFSLPESILLQPPTSSYEAPAPALATAENAAQEEAHEEFDTDSYFDASPSDFLDHELSSVASCSTFSYSSFSSASPCPAGQTTSSESLSNASYTTGSPFTHSRLDDLSNPPPFLFDSELSFTIPFDFHFPPLCATPPTTPGHNFLLTPLYF